MNIITTIIIIITIIVIYIYICLINKSSNNIMLINIAMLLYITIGWLVLYNMERSHQQL